MPSSDAFVVLPQRVTATEAAQRCAYPTDLPLMFYMGTNVLLSAVLPPSKIE